MNYVHNAWYVASWAHDLKPNLPVGMRILDEPIVLWRNSEGVLTALQDRCVHRMAPLSLGRCEGDKLRCMYHGLLFNRHGHVVEIPGQPKIPDHGRVRAFPVAERHSWVWVWMGEAAAADESLIPPAVGLDHPDYILGYGHLDYAAEARLINDNLLDFSHLSYVHAKSFGAKEDWALDRPKITPIERGLRVERWLTSASGIPGRSIDQPTDNYSYYDFLLPGVLLMTGGVFPAGTAQALQHAAPNLEEALTGRTFTSQAVTPMTAKTSRYFFSWGPHKKHGDAALRDTLMGIAGMAFAEDRTIIEAQQRVIDATAAPRIMPISADRAVTMFNLMVDKMVKAESGPLRQVS